MGRRTAPEIQRGLGGALAARYRVIRDATTSLCRPLAREDLVAQSMPDASPAKWHLAHTTWFFETFVLKPRVSDWRPVDPAYEVLFNSYYNSVGEQFPRAQRGLLTRPTVDEVLRYRALVDDAIVAWLQSSDPSLAACEVIELGLQHEQQHQELILTDVKHLLALNPLRPIYSDRPVEEFGEAARVTWHESSGGLCQIGASGDETFSFDNEGPRHRVYLAPYALASRLVTNAEYADFIADGGYSRPELWLSEGWDLSRANRWSAPLYWERLGVEWAVFTLAGMRSVHPNEPVCHVSYFEADAFARWAGARLPDESEWEHAADRLDVAGNFADNERFHPSPAPTDGAPAQMFGDTWEWTRSAYAAYPGFQPPAGALGEYNGKFMCNQFVLRGGSCATPREHVRATYRNFFPAGARWQFSGIRLARDA